MNKSRKTLKHDTYKGMHNANAPYGVLRRRCFHANINMNRKKNNHYRENEVFGLLDMYDIPESEGGIA